MQAEPANTLTLGEAARTLMSANSQGVLSTLSREDGYPYASAVDYLPLADGDAILFLSSLAEHHKYLTHDPRASLFIAPALGQSEMLAEPRLSLLGRVRKVANRDDYRQDYLRRHPQAETYIDFEDFAFFRLSAEKARYIAGFGRMGWLNAGEYQSAEPDPLAEIAAGAIQHMNHDHAESLLDYARAFAGLDNVNECRMVSLDRFGFDLRCRFGEQTQIARITFQPPLLRPGRLRTELAALARQAKTILAGR